MGVMVTGRVVDKQTGNGVVAGVRFAPLPNNDFAGKPGYDGYKSDRTMQPTDAEGRFRVSTIPGKSLLLVRAFGGESVGDTELCPYTDAVPDPDYRDLFQYVKGENGWVFASGGGQEYLKYQNAVKVVDLKQDANETKVDVALDRGKVQKIALRDADGKPLSGVVASGLTPSGGRALKLTEPKVKVLALDPERPRRVVFLHPEKKLGGSAMVRGDETELVVELKPLGAVTGRFLEPDGTPLAGATIRLFFQDEMASGLYREAMQGVPPVTTDKEGRFTLTGIVGGVKFFLQVSQGTTLYNGEPPVGEKQVESGKTLDIGERKLKPVT
jgi:hypothetical protein